MQLLKLQMPKLAGLWGQLIVFMGSFISVTNPPVYDYADFLNDNLARSLGVGLAWLAFAVLRPAPMPAKAAGISGSYAGGLSISSAANRIFVRVNMNRWFIITSASSITARTRFPGAGCCAGAWCC